MLLYLVLFAFPPQYFPPSFFPHSIPLLQSIFHFSALPPPPSLSSFLPPMSDVTIGFEQSSYTIPEAIGALEVVVKAVGTLAQPVTVTLTTKFGTAICEDSWISLCPPLPTSLHIFPTPFPPCTFPAHITFIFLLLLQLTHLLLCSLSLFYLYKAFPHNLSP